MRREGLAGHLAVKVGVAQSFERVGIHPHRGTILFERPQLSGMDQNIGVRGPANLALHGFIVSQRVAVGSEERLAGFPLGYEFVGAHVAMLEVDLAVLDTKPADRAIAPEIDVIA